MKKKYYIVEAKCGHVGRNKYVIVPFATMANTAKEAAAKVRGFGRVKHHWKDAIISVDEVTEEEYQAQIEANRKNPYLRARSIQEQRASCDELEILSPNDSKGKDSSNMKIRAYYEWKERQKRREAFKIIIEYKNASSYGL